MCEFISDAPDGPKQFRIAHVEHVFQYFHILSYVKGFCEAVYTVMCKNKEKVEEKLRCTELAALDYKAVFQDLGYETSKDLGFKAEKVQSKLCFKAKLG